MLLWLIEELSNSLWKDELKMLDINKEATQAKWGVALFKRARKWMHAHHCSIYISSAKIGFYSLRAELEIPMCRLKTTHPGNKCYLFGHLFLFADDMGHIIDFGTCILEAYSLKGILYWGMTRISLRKIEFWPWPLVEYGHLINFRSTSHQTVTNSNNLYLSVVPRIKCDMLQGTYLGAPWHITPWYVTKRHLEATYHGMSWGT